MEFRVIFIALLFALIEIRAKELKPGPQAIKDTASVSNSTQKSQKRYATKEIILYLTPSQIKALQAGKGLISPESISQPIDKQEAEQNDQRLEQMITFQDHDEFVRQQFENIKNAKISNIQQPRYENLELASQIPSYQSEQMVNENQQKYSDFIDIWKQNQEQEQAKSQYLYSQSEENKRVEELTSQKEIKPETVTDAWIAYDPHSEKKQQHQVLDEQFKQQWNRILEQNHYQLKALLADQKENSGKNAIQTEKPLLQTQYGPKYNDQKHAIEIEQILKSQHRQESEKEKALSRAEAIANSPPILIHQEIKVTKHRAVPVVKHVKLHVPTPVLIPVPEPYEVKVPHPYPVPLEIIKPIPVPILKTEKIEVERPVPYEVKKQVQVPITKKVYVNVDRPYYVEKLVPVEIKKEVPVEIPIHKAEKITILRHVWNN